MSTANIRAVEIVISRPTCSVRNRFQQTTSVWVPAGTSTEISPVSGSIPLGAALSSIVIRHGGKAKSGRRIGPPADPISARIAAGCRFRAHGRPNPGSRIRSRAPRRGNIPPMRPFRRKPVFVQPDLRVRFVDSQILQPPVDKRDLRVHRHGQHETEDQGQRCAECPPSGRPGFPHVPKREQIGEQWP